MSDGTHINLQPPVHKKDWERDRRPGGAPSDPWSRWAQEIGCVFETGADPTPAQALYYHKQKPQLAERHPTLSPWAQAKTWPQGVEALTYPSGKSGERAWTHVDTKTASGKGQGTSAQDQPQIREGEGVLRKAHPQGPSMKGLPKFKAHACLGHPRTPRVPPEANTDIGDKQ